MPCLRYMQSYTFSLIMNELLRDVGELYENDRVAEA